MSRVPPDFPLLCPLPPGNSPLPLLMPTTSASSLWVHIACTHAHIQACMHVRAHMLTHIPAHICMPAHTLMATEQVLSAASVPYTDTSKELVRGRSSLALSVKTHPPATSGMEGVTILCPDGAPLQAEVSRTVPSPILALDHVLRGNGEGGLAGASKMKQVRKTGRPWEWSGSLGLEEEAHARELGQVFIFAVISHLVLQTASS